MLPAIIVAVVVAAAVAAVVILRLSKGKEGDKAGPPSAEDESALSWRADAMAGGRPPAPEKPAKGKAAKAAKAAQAASQAANPVADLAAQIAAKPAAPPAQAPQLPPPVEPSVGRNKAAAARNRAAAARNKVKAKPAPAVVAPLSFDPFDDYLSAPTPTRGPDSGPESTPGKTLADVRLGDYRIGEARDPKNDPDGSKKGEGA